jgi:mannan endo-1,4-beta-mannosidase
MIRHYILYQIILSACLGLAHGQITAPPKSPRAQALWTYLNRLPDRPAGHALAGQYVGGDGNLSWSENDIKEYVDGLQTVAGSKPVVLEFSIFQMFTGNFIGNEARFIQILAQKWSEGHILYMAMRPPNAETGGGEHVGASGEPSPQDLASVYTPGTHQYTTFRKNLTLAAGILDSLKRRNIPVLYEPFNEICGNWNWFYPSPDAKFVALWKYTHDYLTKDLGLDNLLWVWEWHSYQPLNMNRYPGDAYVDVLSLSTYDSDPGNKYVATFQSLAARKKPVAFSEFGPNLTYAPLTQKPNPPYFTWDNLVLSQALKTYYPQVGFFIRWNTVWATVEQNNAKAFMADPWIINSNAFALDLPEILAATTHIQRRPDFHQAPGRGASSPGFQYRYDGRRSGISEVAFNHPHFKYYKTTSQPHTPAESKSPPPKRAPEAHHWQSSP